MNQLVKRENAEEHDIMKDKMNLMGKGEGLPSTVAALLMFTDHYEITSL